MLFKLRENIQYVLFSIDDKEFGIKLAQVTEVITCKDIFPVPTTPRFITGMILLRGAIIPVVAIHKKLNLGLQNDDSKSNTLLLVEWQDEHVGILVDTVVEILNLPTTAIEPISSMIYLVNIDYLDGIARLNNNRILFLINLDNLLSISEEERRVLSPSGLIRQWY
jgi:purine-binding chemotaxis protein CheW